MWRSRFLRIRNPAFWWVIKNKCRLGFLPQHSVHCSMVRAKLKNKNISFSAYFERRTWEKSSCSFFLFIRRQKAKTNQKRKTPVDTFASGTILSGFACVNCFGVATYAFPGPSLSREKPGVVRFCSICFWFEFIVGWGFHPNIPFIAA